MTTARKSEGKKRATEAKKEISERRCSLFERRLVLVDLFARELFELEEHVFRGRPSVELRRYRFAVLQRLVDLLPSVEHGGQFVAGRGRRTRRNRSVVHCGQRSRQTREDGGKRLF